MWRKPRWVAVATSHGTRRGRALQAGLSILFFEVTLDKNSEMVFSLRSKQPFVKALEAVHLDLRTSFERQSVSNEL